MLLDQVVDRFRDVRFRGKVRLLSRVVAPKGTRRVQVFGSNMTLDLSIHIDRQVYMGCYEPLNTYRFGRVVQVGDTVFDVGANIGYFTALAARRVGPAGRVFAFEPHPFNFPLLARMIEDNRLRQVTPLEFGLDESDGSGVVHMSHQSDYANRAATMVGSAEGQVAAAVATRSIDSFVKERGNERIDLLKVDVDGFETRILKGAKETLAEGKIRHVIIELSPHWLRASGSSQEEVVRLLAEGHLRDVSDEDRWISRLLGGTDDRHFATSAETQR